MDPLRAEIVLASIGLIPILEAKPELELKPIEKEIGQKVRDFLAHPHREPLDDVPDVDYRRVSKLLSGDPGRMAQALYALMPDEMGQAVANQASRIGAALYQQLPRTVRPELLGASVGPGSASQLDRFARAWSVATDPVVVLRDLAQHSLSSDMVAAFAAFYPALFDFTKETVIDEISTLKAKRPAWDLDDARDRLTRMLLQLPTQDLDLAADFQQLYAGAGGAPSANAPARPRAGKLDTKGTLETPGQKQ